MDYLKEAKEAVDAWRGDDLELEHANTQRAIAYALIALVERLDRASMKRSVQEVEFYNGPLD